MSSQYWFRPKSFGYGATPITWEGWAVTLASAAITVGSILAIVISEGRQWPDRRALQVVCLLLIVATIIASVVVSRAKTDGEWRWRPERDRLPPI
jgi:hypothetical protein